MPYSGPEPEKTRLLVTTNCIDMIEEKVDTTGIVVFGLSVVGIL